MRAAFDTSVLVSGLLWRGAPFQLVTLIQVGLLDMVTSPASLDEFAEVMGRPKFARLLDRAALTPAQAVDGVRALAELQTPSPLSRVTSRDPDDDEVLALAVHCGVDVILTGDDDLLVLGTFESIPILDAAAGLAFVRGN